MSNIEEYKKELEKILKESITKRAERNITYQPRLNFGEALLLLYPTEPSLSKRRKLRKLAMRTNNKIPLRKCFRALGLDYKHLVYKNKFSGDTMSAGTKVCMI